MDRRRPGRREVQGSAAWLALGLLVLSGGAARPGETLRPCPAPAETTRVHGWTHEIRCDASGPGAERFTGPARLLFGLPLDLNRARPEALELLPRIGPRRAEAIVAARPYARVEELTRIAGIGPVTLAGLEGRVRVDPKPAQGEITR